MATSVSHIIAMTARTFDVAAVNAVCNDPAVLPGLSLGLGEVDATALLADTRNVAFLGEHGGALFHRVAPDTYAAHDFFLLAGRGRWALAASREMLARMYDEHGARMIFAETPVENAGCRMFNRWLGFTSRGVSEVPLYSGGPVQAVETFVMERF